MLAGFNDGRANEGVQAGPATLVGLELAKARGDKAPAYPGGSSPSDTTQQSQDS